MQLQQMTILLVAGVNISSLMLAGCNQQRQFDVGEELISTEQTQATAPNGQTVQRQPDVPYVPTPNQVVAQMLQIADVKGDDILYDLGSGDGRIAIAAAQKFGTRSIGIDINPQRIREANANAQKAGVTKLVEFRQQDLFATDMSQATVVTLYLLPNINVKLRPKLLQELKPGTRIVSHDFDMGKWQPERVVKVQGPVRQHTIYYWVVPQNPPNNLL